MHVGSGVTDQQRQCLDLINQPLKLPYSGIGSSFGAAAKAVSCLKTFKYRRVNQSSLLRVPMSPSKLKFRLTVGCQSLTGTEVHKLAFMTRLLRTASHIQAI